MVGGWGRVTGKETKRNSRGTKRKPRLWGVVVVNPHSRVRSATTLPPVCPLFLPLLLPGLSSSFLSSSGSLVFSLASPLFFRVYISSFLKFLNIRSIGSRSLGKNRVGRHEMSTVGTAVSPSPVHPGFPLLFPPARPIGCFRQDLSVFHRARDRCRCPPCVFELIIRYPFVAARPFLRSSLEMFATALREK